MRDLNRLWIPIVRCFYRAGHLADKERNCCYLNLGDRATAFANISAATGVDFPDDGRSLVTVDWDQDGDLDIWLSNRNAPRLRFLRNDMPVGSHSLMVQLIGNGVGYQS